MKKRLELFRVNSPYLWRLRPHAVLPIVILVALILPSFGERFVPVAFSDLEDVESLQAVLRLKWLVLQTLVIAALARWALQLAAFPLYSASWSRVLWTLLFYWVIIAGAFLGPDRAINRGLRKMHAAISSPRDAPGDLERLKAICDVASGNAPSPELVALVERWFAGAVKAGGFERVTLDWSRGYWTSQRERRPGDQDRHTAGGIGVTEDAAYPSVHTVDRLMKFCHGEDADAIYRKGGFLVWSPKVDAVRSLEDPSLVTMANLIGGLGTVTALSEYVDHRQGPLAGYIPATGGYIAICLVASIALWLTTERVGRGSFRVGHLGDFMREKLPHMTADLAPSWMARNRPYGWGLGIPRIVSDVLISAGITIVSVIVLDELHFTPIFTEKSGRVSETVSDPFPGSIGLWLAVMLGVFAFREPGERLVLSGYWRSFWYALLAAAHYALLYGIGILSILAAHEVWSHFSGLSNVSSLSVFQRYIEKAGSSYLAVSCLISLLYGTIAAVVRLTYLAGGHRLAAGTFLAIIFAATLLLFLVKAMPDKYSGIVALSGLILSIMAPSLYPARGLSHPWIHGVFLGILPAVAVMCSVSLFVVFKRDIRGFFGVDSYSNGYDVVAFSASFVLTIGLWSRGFARVTRALQWPA